VHGVAIASLTPRVYQNKGKAMSIGAAMRSSNHSRVPAVTLLSLSATLSLFTIPWGLAETLPEASSDMIQENENEPREPRDRTYGALGIAFELNTPLHNPDGTVARTGVFLSNFGVLHQNHWQSVFGSSTRMSGQSPNEATHVPQVQSFEFDLFQNLFQQIDIASVPQCSGIQSQLELSRDRVDPQTAGPKARGPRVIEWHIKKAFSADPALCWVDPTNQNEFIRLSAEAGIEIDLNPEDIAGSFESRGTLGGKILFVRSDWMSSFHFSHLPGVGENRVTHITQSRIDDHVYIGTKVSYETRTDSRYLQPQQSEVLSGTVSVGVAF